MRLMRTRAFAGTKEERTAFQAAKQATRREVMLKRMNPQQQQAALKQESAAKASQAAQTKRAADDKTLRTKGITGTKEEREAFRKEKSGLLRERVLGRMTPEQREKALKQEGAAKASQAAQSKRDADDKTLRTKGFTGTKEEREAFRKEKSGLLRERALERMTPEQREAALKQESAAHAAAAARTEAKRKAKIRRTVAVVGNKEEREAFRQDKQEIRRQDMLDRMSPDQQERALKQEADYKAAVAAKHEQEEAAKASRTVAIVGDKAERDAFRSSRSAPRGTPTVKETPGLALSNSRLTHEMAELEKEVALLA